MARITVEDCITKISNQFELTLTAATRARSLSNGSNTNLPQHEIVNSAGVQNKPAVIALKEISAGIVTSAILTQGTQSAKSAQIALSAQAAQSEQKKS